MSWQAPNLARRPFVNLRPLRRTSIALTVVGVALTAWNAASYLRAGSGAAAKSAEVARLVSETAAARERVQTIEGDLAGRDLAAENERARFLNDRIAQRTFDWNALFDRLSEVQPDGVRLRSLTPRFGAAASDRTAGSRVSLSLDAEATDGEAMLEFIDNLFAHGSFASPNLSREARQRGGDVAFVLTVDYDPEAKP